MVHSAAVAIPRTLFDAHNPEVVAERGRAVRGTDGPVDHATPSLLFAGECGNDGLTAWYKYQGIILRHAEDRLPHGAPATPWSASISHIGPHTTCYSRTMFQRN
jgi:hypothetical protein